MRTGGNSNRNRRDGSAGLRVRVYLPVSSPAGERRPRQESESLVEHGRDDLALEVTPDDRVIGLHRGERLTAERCRGAERFHQLPREHVRAAEGSEPCRRAHRVVERAQYVVDRRVSGSCAWSCSRST